MVLTAQLSWQAIQEVATYKDLGATFKGKILFRNHTVDAAGAVSRIVTSFLECSQVVKTE